MTEQIETLDKFNEARTKWPSGPWQTEPDRIYWVGEDGLPRLVHRGPIGALCGYVAVPPGHPWHGKEYGEIDADVHGGLTYSDKCQGTICHIAEPGEPDDVWWLGFDCAHSGDIYPSEFRSVIPSSLGESYRDVSYVRRQCELLARQAVEAA